MAQNGVRNSVEALQSAYEEWDFVTLHLRLSQNGHSKHQQYCSYPVNSRFDTANASNKVTNTLLVRMELRFDDVTLQTVVRTRLIVGRNRCHAK